MSASALEWVSNNEIQNELEGDFCLREPSPVGERRIPRSYEVLLFQFAKGKENLALFCTGPGSERDGDFLDARELRSRSFVRPSVVLFSKKGRKRRFPDSSIPCLPAWRPARLLVRPSVRSPGWQAGRQASWVAG